MDDSTPSSAALATLLVAAIIWGGVAFIATIAIVCSRPASEQEAGKETSCMPCLDDDFKCLRFCRRDCCLFPCYFLIYYICVFVYPAVIVVGLVLRLGSEILKKAGVRTCCGYKLPCLNQPTPKKKNKTRRKPRVDLEAGNRGGDGSGGGRRPSAVAGEGAALGTGFVSSAPQPEVPMVAAPKTARTNTPRNSRNGSAGPRRPSGAQQSEPRTSRNSTGPRGNPTAQQARIQATPAPSGRTRETTEAPLSGDSDRTPPPKYEELDP
ncbi:hypothetical protein B0T21DRAFT_416962 [Apiosordaria backusii]|uniref:Transmembrane protein n=1 Tax=Apiosordaria backusii TaxID=314023 RepID=A0AA39ZS12_9PEZI|nr:hypothetical protein B0T21DRAFT_416962 [Apiosordaria backusii]